MFSKFSLVFVVFFHLSSSLRFLLKVEIIWTKLCKFKKNPENQKQKAHNWITFQLKQNTVNLAYKEFWYKEWIENLLI